MALLHAMSLFEKQQSGENTDCAFVFEVPIEDGKKSEIKIINGHRFILSAVSPYFEAAFKGEWKGDQPILITSFEPAVFYKLIKAIYVGKCPFNNANEISELYAAAHFYQTESVLDLLREEIVQYYTTSLSPNISPVVDIALKYQDLKLMAFSSKYFAHLAHAIVQSPDFLTFSFDSINFLYQFDDVSANEEDLLSALEKVVKQRGPDSTKTLKPAIGAIRFLSVSDRIKDTKLLTQAEKDYLIGYKIGNFMYLSKNKDARREKPFLSYLPPQAQHLLQEKFSRSSCWVCKAYDHGVITCREARKKYPFYSNFTYFNLEEYHKSTIIEFINFCKIMPDCNSLADLNLQSILYLD